MMRCILLMIVLSNFLSTAYAQCISDENSVFSFTYSGTNYEIVRENQRWINAAGCAVERGGFLTEIDSQEEQDSIFFYVNQASISAANTVAPDGGGASYLWIGGNDLATEATWIWDGDNTGTTTSFWQGTASGMPLGGLYNNWGNEPDDFNGQDGLALALTNWPLGVAGQWNDVDENNTLYFIIEYPSNTASLEEKSPEEIQLYPNPTKGEITIELTKEALPVEIEITTTSGKVIQRQLIQKPEEIIQIEGDSGLYHARIYRENQLLRTLKINKQ